MSGSSADVRDAWADKIALAEEMIPLLGSLYRNNHVVLSVYGRSLVNRSVIDIIKAHRFARQFNETELPLSQTAPIVRALAGLELGAASIDLGRLAYDFAHSAADDLIGYLRAELADVIGRSGRDDRPDRDVVLYGFGRIGRLLARILIGREGGGHGLVLRAIVVRKGAENDLDKRASLLRRDSVHGQFDGSIVVDHQANTITANGTVIQVIYSDDPATVDYTQFGIENAIVVDNTGKWRDEAGLSQHLSAKGAGQVLLTAPGKGDLPNIVFGINHQQFAPDTAIMTAASCTTNAATPVLKAINDEFGVEHCHVETVHSYTNDQNLIDNFHKGNRRGRGAPLNMVLTETGAAKAVAKALPELTGKLTGSSIRVPTPDVSMAILNLTLSRHAGREELNRHLRRMSLNSPLQRQIDYVDSPDLVSTDIVGSIRAGVVDGLATIADSDHAVVYVWYDNEMGYSAQVVRIMEYMAGANSPIFPLVPAQ